MEGGNSATHQEEQTFTVGRICWNGYHLVILKKIKQNQQSNYLVSEPDLQIKQEAIMKKSTRDQAEGKFHQVKGKIKEMAGKLSDNPKLEIEGKSEITAGKIQVKTGQARKALGK